MAGSRTHFFWVQTRHCLLPRAVKMFWLLPFDSPGCESCAYGTEASLPGAGVAGVQRRAGLQHRRGMTGDSRSDGELLAALPGQPELMGVLYERHAPAVFRYLARRAGLSAAEDLLSEVFITALSASARVVAHDSGGALPWLYGISLNVLRAHFRRQPPVASVVRDLGMDWNAVDDRLDALAERGRLRTALDGLADSDRELLLLVAWEGLSPAEAAAALGITQVAARSRLHRARKRAMKALQQPRADLSTSELVITFSAQEKTS
jgi:RNA polymerase sigma factor (sigma-70 family)